MAYSAHTALIKMIRINESGENNLPKIGEKSVFQVSKKSWLKVTEGFQGKEETDYANLDISNTPDFTIEEFDRLCNSEGALRKDLKQIDTWDKTPQETAELIKKADLTEVLMNWRKIHFQRIAAQMKMGKGDILLTPTTQLLLEAARILEAEQEQEKRQALQDLQDYGNSWFNLYNIINAQGKAEPTLIELKGALKERPVETVQDYIKRKGETGDEYWKNVYKNCSAEVEKLNELAKKANASRSLSEFSDTWNEAMMLMYGPNFHKPRPW